MMLLVAGQAAERRHVLGAVAARQRATKSAAVDAIRRHHAGRRAALSDMRDPVQRKAAQERIALEETAEVASVMYEQEAAGRAERQSLAAALKTAHTAARRALRLRHRHQAMAAAVVMRVPVSLGSDQHTPWPAVRALAKRIGTIPRGRPPGPHSGGH
jgi:arginase family enzyme